MMPLSQEPDTKPASKHTGVIGAAAAFLSIALVTLQKWSGVFDQISGSLNSIISLVGAVGAVMALRSQFRREPAPEIPAVITKVTKRRKKRHKK